MAEETSQTGADVVTSAPVAVEPEMENAPAGQETPDEVFAALRDATPEEATVPSIDEVIESTQEVVAAPGVAPKAADKPKVTRLYRGRQCEVIRTTKNTVTGAIYDLVLFPRSIRNKYDASSTDVYLGVKLRRPGTGVVAAKEVEIAYEVEV